MGDINNSTAEIQEALDISYDNDPTTNGSDGYNDVQGNLGTANAGASAPTARNMTIGGVDFRVKGWAVNNTGTLVMQTSHDVKLNEALEQHIHYAPDGVTSSGDQFKLQVDVAAAGVDGTFALVTGSPFTVEHTFAGDESGDHNYLDCATIPAVNDTVSTLYFVKLTRIAATTTEYSGEIYLFYADGHILHDQTRGSRQETVK